MTPTRSWVDAVTDRIDLPARILMSIMFLFSGCGKLSAIGATEAYMHAQGMPGILVWPAALWEMSAGLLMLLGWMIRPLSLLLAGWCFLTALVFHAGWSNPDQIIHFLKNVTLTGAFLMLAKSGSRTMSVDALAAGRQRLPA